MALQPAEVRNKNFGEVACGYTAEEAKKEAERCLGCKKQPCVLGCPVEVKIPQFIDKIAEGDFVEAYRILLSTNSLPAVCGRVCPQEVQCEARCIVGKKGEPVAIGRLERFAADYMKAHPELEDEISVAESVGKKVGVIGGGPAGLTCAADLADAGVDVTIFESLHDPGGVLVYGIPEFRLPKGIVRYEVDKIRKKGVKIETNMVIGKILSIEELARDHGYDAFFVATGAGLPYFMRLKGEGLNGVYSANEYLTRVNLMKAYDPEKYDTPVNAAKKVVVFGGGNVAMDSARVAQRLGAEKVYIVYRRSKVEMPARVEEVEHAEEEGIIFELLTNPVEIIGDENGNVRAVKCIKMHLGEPDDSGRRRPIPIPDSEYEVEADTVVVAIGQGPNPLLTHSTKGLDLNRRGNIVADDSGQTSLPGVFAGGDIVTGAATVILAMGAGRVGAQSILKYLGLATGDDLAEEKTE